MVVSVDKTNVFSVVSKLFCKHFVVVVVVVFNLFQSNDVCKL